MNCQYLLNSSEHRLSESVLRRSTRIKYRILDHRYKNSPLSIDIYYDEMCMNHDLDGTYILDWLELNNFKFSKRMYKDLMYFVYFKRDRTPSFLTYTWAYDRLSIPFAPQHECDVTFYLFIILEAIARKDITLFNSFKFAHKCYLDFTTLESCLEHMFINRGWNYFIPWFINRFNIDPRCIYMNAHEFTTLIQSALIDKNIENLLQTIQNLSFSTVQYNVKLEKNKKIFK